MSVAGYKPNSIFTYLWGSKMWVPFINENTSVVIGELVGCAVSGIRALRV